MSGRRRGEGHEGGVGSNGGGTCRGGADGKLVPCGAEGGKNVAKKLKRTRRE